MKITSIIVLLLATIMITSCTGNLKANIRGIWFIQEDVSGILAGVDSQDAEIEFISGGGLSLSTPIRENIADGYGLVLSRANWKVEKGILIITVKGDGEFKESGTKNKFRFRGTHVSPSKIELEAEVNGGFNGDYITLIKNK